MKKKENPYKTKILNLEKAGYTLSEIAKFCGLKIKTIRNIKAGPGRTPGRYTCLRINQLHDGIK